MFKNLLMPAFLAAGLSLSATPAPDFTITDSDGQVRQLYADFVNQGKVVVLEVFFVSCPPCATHAPYWQSLYGSMKTKYPGKVEFIMLSDKSADNNAAVAQYKISKGLTMLAAGSNGGSLNAVQPYKSGQFGPFYGTPTFIVIKPGTGEVIFDVRGNDPAGTMDSIAGHISSLLLPKCRITTYQGDTLKNYTMTVSVPGGMSVSAPVTEGAFSLEDFSALPPLPFYQAVPTKKDNPLNGVSTFDLVQINKQILGIEPFLHPWQFIAGDANGSGTITTFDIVELRKLILGVYDSLPGGQSWVFSPAMDTISPLECPAFYAIKKGDVNGNADPAGISAKTENRDENAWPLFFENRPLEAGQTYRLLFYAGAAGEWQGLQAAWRFDPGALEIRSVESGQLTGFDAEAWHVADGRLVLSWFGDAPATITAQAPLMILEIRVLRNGQAGEMLTMEPAPLHAEGYDAAGEIHPLEWQPIREAGGGSIWPNPAKEYFIIQMKNSAAEYSVLQLLDFSGKVAYRQTLRLTNADGLLNVIPGALPSGIYGVQVDNRLVGKLFWQQ